LSLGKNAMFRRNLAVINSNMADVLVALNRMDDALIRRREALAAFQALADADLRNAAAKNDLAISIFKIAEMQAGSQKPRDALASYERALGIHQSLAASDPGNASMKLEIASDYSSMAIVQATLGDRASSIANHTRAVTMTQQLSAANPDNVEVRVAVALASIGRGDAYAHFARAQRAAEPAPDLHSAERDYATAVDILSRLEQQRAIDGTDIETLQKARRELHRIRLEPGSTR